MKRAKLFVTIQNSNLVIHCGGCMTYRTVELELTEEQSKKLRLRDGDDYGPISIYFEPNEGCEPC